MGRFQLIVKKFPEASCLGKWEMIPNPLGLWLWYWCLLPWIRAEESPEDICSENLNLAVPRLSTDLTLEKATPTPPVCLQVTEVRDTEPSHCPGISSPA